MIIDKLTTLASGVALNTGAAGTYNIGDLINMEALRDLGQGNPIYLVISVETTATSGGAATAAFQLVSDATSTVSTTTQTVHVTSAAHPVADMVAGKSLFVIALPQEGEAYEQYLGIQQITAAAAFTAGAVDAFLTQTPAAWKAYADAAN